MQVNNASQINEILTRIRALSLESATGMPDRDSAGKTGSAQFSTLLGQAINTVNDLQHKAGEAAAALERGDPGVDIASVMIATQKAGIAFEAMAQVRNRLVSAYQDIMNMPI